MNVPDSLVRHLRSALGAWPPPSDGVTVVSSPARSRPGWDGSVRMVSGVSTADGSVLSVPEEAVEEVRRLGDDLETIVARLPATLGRPGWRFYSGVFRWSVEPAPGPDRGVWLPTDDPRVLPWLKPFNGEVLVGFDGDQVAAGVGRKQHDPWGHELAVVTEPGHRGRGWARDLVTQAARRVLAEGAVPIYNHGPVNAASARTADAAGFPDRGWRIHGLADPTRR